MPTSRSSYAWTPTGSLWPSRSVCSRSGRQRMKNGGRLLMHGDLDPAALASQALPLLVTYLRHLGGRFADHVADDLNDLVLGKLSANYERFKARVTGESFAGQALERLEQESENTRCQSTFEDALAEVVQGDPSFAATLPGLLEDARLTAAPTLTRIDGRDAAFTFYPRGQHGRRDLRRARPSCSAGHRGAWRRRPAAEGRPGYVCFVYRGTWPCRGRPLCAVACVLGTRAGRPPVGSLRVA